jgi:peptide/nickel transport system substrate-binding protein
MRITRFFAAAAGIALAGGLAACSSSATIGAQSSGRPVHGGTLNVALYSDIQNINPITSEDPVAQLMWGNWWQYAVYATPNGQSLQPMLATSWKISPGYKTYTFQIRPRVR